MKVYQIIFFTILSILALNFSSFAQENALSNTQETIKWMSWQEADAANQKNPKKIFVDVFTDWCGWCKKMDASTFVDPQIVKYMNENFYAVKFDAEQKEEIVFQGNSFKFLENGRRGVHTLAYALLDGKMGYPSFALLNEKYERVKIASGFRSPEQLIKELEFTAKEIYLTNTWATYEANGFQVKK